jgi:hypothetical protein
MGRASGPTLHRLPGPESGIHRSRQRRNPTPIAGPRVRLVAKRISEPAHQPDRLTAPSISSEGLGGLSCSFNIGCSVFCRRLRRSAYGARLWRLLDIHYSAVGTHHRYAFGAFSGYRLFRFRNGTFHGSRQRRNPTIFKTYFASS